MKDRHSIDELFRRKLSGRTVQPTSADWAAMEQLLSSSRKPWWKRFGWLFTMTVVVGATGWASYQWSNASNEATPSNSAVVETSIQLQDHPMVETAAPSSLESQASASPTSQNAGFPVATASDKSAALHEAVALAQKGDSRNELSAARIPNTRSHKDGNSHRNGQHALSAISEKSSIQQASRIALGNQPTQENIANSTTSITTSAQSSAQVGTTATAGDGSSVRVSFDGKETAAEIISKKADASKEEETVRVSPIDFLAAQWPSANRYSLEPHTMQLPVRIPSWSVRASAGWLSMQRTLEGSNTSYFQQRIEQEQVFPGFTAQLEAEKQWHRWSLRTGVGFEKWHEDANYRGTIVGDSVVTNSFYEYFTYVDSVFQNGQIVYITVTDSTLIELQDTIRTAIDNQALRTASGRIDWSVFSIPISLAYRMPGMPLGGTWRLDAGVRIDFAVARSGNYLATDRLKSEAVSAGGFTKTSYSLSLGAEWRRNLAGSGWYVFVHPQWRYGLTSWNSNYQQRYSRWAMQGGIGFQLPARK